MTDDHAPQLLLSFDSVTVPVLAAELLSAQARTNQVPAEGKAYERVAFMVPPALSVLAEVCVPISVVPVPPLLVARWKSVEKPAGTDALPPLVTVD